MIFHKEHQSNHKINQLVGKPIQSSWKSPKTVGGPGLFIKSFTNKTGGTEKIKIDSKCNFEKRPDGLLLHTNFSNKRALVPIQEKDIAEIRIVRGKEKISPTPFYPMWILLKLSVPIVKARYLGGRQYSIEPMELQIKTTNYEMDFIANGYLFERHLSFFKNLAYGNKLRVVKRASYQKSI